MRRSLPPGQWVPIPPIPGIPDALREEGAHLPHPLPSDLVLPVATYRLAAETEHWLGRLDEAANRLGVRDGLVRATQVRDAQSSAGLAGKMVGLRRAFVADLFASSGRSPEDVAADGADESDASRRIAPFLMAYDHGLRRVREGAPVDGRVLAEMSAIMTGRPAHPVEEMLRKEHGWLGRSPEQAYLLTAVGAHLPALLEQWSTWVRDRSDQPRSVKMGIAHFQIEVVQPFPAANGHVARSFSMVELVRSGLLGDQILPLSVWLDDNLDDYQERIRAVVDTRLIHHWVEFYLTALRDQARAQLRLIAALEDTAAAFTARLSGSGTRQGVAADVVRRLVGFPVTSHAALREHYGITLKAATNATQRLCDLGILTRWESRSYRQVFLCEPVLDLLSLNFEG
ncbi:hypothetical protein L6E12_31090 [Actinokineospora sp. PR83]|uniref:Fic family protein n=1 Tax=Actinokineospora sp. PR83 TaxID=2884908 RepID=UPI001F2AAAAE|nr:hypothetical protein [Actinokineospora sp. PR83]MCG8920224.1 hypothetical protein [Actinokineospora sp. PR83]